MKRVVIAGAGGFGRGVYGWLRGSTQHLDSHGVTEVVFIDDGFSSKAPAPIVSTIHEYSPRPDDEVICAIADPTVRRAVTGRLQSLGATFHTFVDDRAVIGSRVFIGEGAIICPGVVVSADAVVGAHVHINFNCSIGHDSVLGAFNTLSPAVNIMGEVSVGESVFIGGSAVVLPRLSLAPGVVVGAGATVVRGIDHAMTVIGTPAAPLYERSASR